MWGRRRLSSSQNFNIRMADNKAYWMIYPTIIGNGITGSTQGGLTTMDTFNDNMQRHLYRSCPSPWSPVMAGRSIDHLKSSLDHRYTSPQLLSIRSITLLKPIAMSTSIRASWARGRSSYSHPFRGPVESVICPGVRVTCPSTSLMSQSNRHHLHDRPSLPQRGKASPIGSDY